MVGLLWPPSYQPTQGVFVGRILPWLYQAHLLAAKPMEEVGTTMPSFESGIVRSQRRCRCAYQVDDETDGLTQMQTEKSLGLV
jgi:hypothetical protein